MIWAAAGVSVYNGTQGLWDATTSLAGQSALVYDICIRVLGPVGGVLAMIGVIVCPITSGDTAFRSEMCIRDRPTAGNALFREHAEDMARERRGTHRPRLRLLRIGGGRHLQAGGSQRRDPRGGKRGTRKLLLT